MPTEIPPPLNPDAPVPLVGMYSIPVRLMGEVVRRACNCLFHFESDDGKVSQADWRAACRANGLRYFDVPSADLEADAEDPFLVGWVINGSDEWNRRRGPTNALKDVAPFVAEAERLHAFNASRVARGLSKVYVCANADGPSITTALFEKPPYNGMANNERALMRRLNGLFMDWYPVVQTQADTPEQIGRRPMHLPAQALQRIVDWMRAENVNTRIVPQFCGAIVEMNTGSGRPLAVTPAQMREQIGFLLGRAAFPYPADPQFDGKRIVQKVIDDEAKPRAIIEWTANGRDGAGWKWIAQTEAQAQAQLDINRELLALDKPTPTPPVDPPPTPVDPTAALRAEFDAFKVNASTMLAALVAQTNAATARLDNIAAAAGRQPAGASLRSAPAAVTPLPLVGDDRPFEPRSE